MMMTLMMTLGTALLIGLGRCGPRRFSWRWPF
jgi:hypothetical protein